MARVTVEDCIEKIPNRFALILAAVQRARQISSGMPLRVERDRDKNTVVALREIAEGEVDQEEMRESVIQQFLSAQPVFSESSPLMEGDEGASERLSPPPSIPPSLDEDALLQPKPSSGEDSSEERDSPQS